MASSRPLPDARSGGGAERAVWTSGDGSDDRRLTGMSPAIGLSPDAPAGYRPHGDGYRQTRDDRAVPTAPDTQATPSSGRRD
ncbi:hypothetical protein FRAHR75_780005 [Frankia sp. Hr75.2]|nr:hypothetical protein FRAHR75_780005 [Frankia sp. Hr75.2]SQE00581.1 hypothetical protein FMEAI12_6730015 [Parafrankia sp. Ea1.12]